MAHQNPYARQNGRGWRCCLGAPPNHAAPFLPDDGASTSSGTTTVGAALQQGPATTVRVAQQQAAVNARSFSLMIVSEDLSLLAAPRKCEVTAAASLEQLHMAIEQQLSLKDTVVVRIYDDDFAEWIQPYSLDLVPPKAKVQVVRQGRAEAATSVAQWQQLLEAAPDAAAAVDAVVNSHMSPLGKTTEAATSGAAASSGPEQAVTETTAAAAEERAGSARASRVGALQAPAGATASPPVAEGGAAGAFAHDPSCEPRKCR